VPRKLQEKIEAGAQFIQMHICMDIDLLRGYMKHLVAGKLIRRVSVMASVAVIESAEDAKWLRENRPNVMIPDAIVERLEGAEDPQNEGKICAEVLRELATIPGIAGANVIATRDLATIPAAIRMAGISS